MNWLRELVEGYHPDGIWVDGDWPVPSSCSRCQAEYRKATGWREPRSEIVKRPDFEAATAAFWNRIESD